MSLLLIELKWNVGRGAQVPFKLSSLVNYKVFAGNTIENYRAAKCNLLSEKEKVTVFFRSLFPHYARNQYRFKENILTTEVNILCKISQSGLRDIFFI